MTEESKAEQALRELEANALPAEPDTEDKLRRMRTIKADLIPRLEAEYTELRDELVGELDGARFFLDEHGNKVYGFPVRPVKLVADLNVLEEALPPEVLAEVTETKVRIPKLAQAYAAGRIPDDVYVRATREQASTPHIRFNDGGRDEA